MTRLSDQTQFARAERRKAELWLIQIGPDPDAQEHLLALAREVMSQLEYHHWLQGHGQYSANRSRDAKSLGIVV